MLKGHGINGLGLNLLLIVGVATALGLQCLSGFRVQRALNCCDAPEDGGSVDRAGRAG